MRATRSQPSFVAQHFGDSLRHPVFGIFLALVFVPQMMGDEAQHRRFRRRPDERLSRRGARPGFEIGEIGGERPQRIRPRAGFGEMRQRVDFRRGQLLGQTIARDKRQKSGERVDRQVVARRHDASPIPSTGIFSARAAAASFLSSVASGNCSAIASAR